MNRNKTSLLLVLISVLLLVLVACGGAGDETTALPNAGDTGTDAGETAPTVAVEPEVPTDVPAPELFGDSLRGGLLYDKWWVPLGLDTPEEDHPLWATQDTNTRSGSDSWRCKECHGWDYKGAEGAYSSGSHFTGFAGVIQLAGGDPIEALAALMGVTNPDHDFSTVMNEQALIDLALFISEEIVDYSGMVADDKAALSDDLAGGETLYQAACAGCHGSEGMAINFGELANDTDYISGIANGNPWEFLHKARFGQPGTFMPSVIDFGWTLEEQAALLTFAQSLPNDNPTTQGGQLYDKWWKALGLDAPEEDNPLWATQDTNTRSGDDTWRCKECHGWDYQGAAGAYGSGSHFTGFPGVFGSSGDVLGWLNGTANADHDFSSYLDDVAMNMLVAFVQDGTVDMSLYVNEDKSVNGDPSSGEALYKSTCARCHGSGAMTMNFGDETDPEYLFDLAAGNPWEVLHKIANGQPNEDMPAGINLGWSWQDMADIVAFLQSLVSE